MIGRHDDSRKMKGQRVWRAPKGAAALSACGGCDVGVLE
jgi:hypothetical protein